MGACESDSVIESSQKNKKNPKKQNNTIDGPDPNFPDMKEWKGNRYKGIGIKKMKGYKCNLPIDKLNKKREEF